MQVTNNRFLNLELRVKITKTEIDEYPKPQTRYTFLGMPISPWVTFWESTWSTCPKRTFRNALEVLRTPCVEKEKKKYIYDLTEDKKS